MATCSNVLNNRYREWEMLLSSLSYKLHDKLTASNEFDAFSTIYKSEGVRKIFTKWLSDVKAEQLKTCDGSGESKLSLEKSKTLSSVWREKGNQSLATGDIYNCLKYYNLSVLAAPRDDQTFPLALANRSVVLMRMAKYKEAERDTRLALQCGYPPDKKGKLLARLRHCNQYAPITEVLETNAGGSEDAVNRLAKQLQRVDVEGNNCPTLSKLLPGKHPSLEGASPTLELKYSKKYGRYITVNRDIEKGETLFVEKPYAFVALPGSQGVLPDVCENCCSSGASVCPIPCSDCAGSIYCSEECRREGWQRFHRWECWGTRTLLWPTIGIAHLALRVLLIGSLEKFGLQDSEVQQGQSAAHLLESICRANSSPSTTAGYHTVYNLLTNFDKMPKKDLLHYTLTSVMLVSYLKLHTKWLQEGMLGKGEEAEVCAGALLLRHLGQLVSSGHSIGETLSTGDNEAISPLERRRVATAIYPSASMMNHSCDPDIVNNHCGQVLVVRARRALPEGAQVHNSYGPTYRREEGSLRRAQLITQYHFLCRCSACHSPDKDDFAEVFNAWLCEQCSGAVLESRGNKCLECGAVAKNISLMQCSFQESLLLYDQAQNSNSSKAIKQLRRVLEIQKNCLYKYHASIRNTYNALAQLYATEGVFDKSAECVKAALPSVRQQFGEHSPELGHELHKLASLLLQPARTSNSSHINRQVYVDVQDMLNTVVEIFELHYGARSSHYQEAWQMLQHVQGLIVSPN